MPGPEPGRRSGRIRSATAGVTLVEMLVALVLFALIGAAGFGVLDQILRTQSATEGRLERLARIQRGMYLLTTDFSQARPATVTYETGDRGPVLSLERSAAETGAGRIALTYRLRDSILLRDVSDAAGQPVARQPLLDGVTDIAWQFYDADLGWVDEWPPLGQGSAQAERPSNPVAISAVILLEDAQQLRRVATLPSEPR
ncbi:type II secretion system protein GspJ [Paracoccus sp. WLY502]|uniref:type II secretion system protein GspJ n=1 Tax=Paracoccus yibinensis TaxID=3068891 RepID=UPI0027967AC6|nr:type II secretion system protein GspJ [Paracoccus sp. WLY502]MDQ1901658.1 type II secretion system protein GspJ [Paracoccus sp. WLY502]